MLCRAVIPYFVKLQPKMMWVKGSSVWLSLTLRHRSAGTVEGLHVVTGSCG